MSLQRLYVDESGSVDFSDPHSDHFLVCGLMIRTEHEQYLRQYANFIRKKYFGNTHHVFHAKTLFKERSYQYLKGVGAKLKNAKTREKFYEDLVFLIREARFQLITVRVDKRKYHALGLKSTNVQEDAYHMLIKAFFRRLMLLAEKHGARRGQIIFEQSSNFRDVEIHKAYNQILAGKWAKYGFDARAVRKFIVSIKYVSKDNQDTEVQIADILAYACAKVSSNNFATPEQEKVLKQIHRIAEKRRFVFTDFETKKRQNSMVELPV